MIASLFQVSLFQCEKVSYYTVQVSGRPTSEMVDFYSRMKVNGNEGQLGIIGRRITQIGNLGADKRFFEREALMKGGNLPDFHFLKGNAQTDLCARLYCVRLSDSIVILLNGGCKTEKNIRDCENCRSHYEFAVKISDALKLAEMQGKIGTDGLDLLIDDDFLLQL